MLLTVKKNLLSANKYQLKAPYNLKPEYIVVHNTANDASAANEVSYMIRNENQTGFHYAVDDIEIVQGIPDNRNAWHAGDGNGKGNRKGLGIEICYSRSGGIRFDAAEKLAAQFIAQKMEEHNIPIDNVIRHYDCSGKICPHRTMEKGWERFLEMVKSYLGEGDAEVIQEVKMKINGRMVKVQSIVKDGQNFVKLQDLRLNGLDVKFDEKAKMPEINFTNK